MKAIRVSNFGGSEQLRIEDVPDLKPGAGEVVVSIKAAGVNPVDAYIRTGTYSLKPTLPYTPGIDGAGVISKVGNDVKNFAAGDRVYVSRPITGTYAEECLSSAQNVRLLPEKASFEQGAALGIPYATAYRALFQLAQVRGGELVLIHGASGGVGLAAVQLARANGATVIGTSSTEKGRALVIANGAHHSLDHSSEDLPQQLAALTNSKGANVILEMLANKNLAKDLSLVAVRGRIVVIGNRGATELNIRDAMAKDAVIFSMVLFNATIEELNSAHAAIRAGLETGALHPVVSRTFPLAEAARAHDAISAPAGGNLGKIVLLP